MTDERMTHPHLEGLIRKWRDRACYHEAAAEQEGLSEAQEQWRNGMAEMAYDCANELAQALAALPGGGVEECQDCAAQFEDALGHSLPCPKHRTKKSPTPNPHEADRNGRGDE